MKKFLKVLLIIILVCASVGITTFLFYSNLNKDVDNFTSLNTFASGKDNDKFLQNLQSVQTSSGDGRFTLLYNTNLKLDSAMQALANYLILEKEYNFKDKNIKNSYSNLNSSKNFAISTMDEYFAKISAGEPDPARADGVYIAFADYFVNYAKMLKNFNEELKVFGLNKDVDLKFALIEIYSNVCIETFSNLTKNEIPLQVKNRENIDYLNRVFVLNNSFVETNNELGDFSYLNTEFLIAYNKCNKEEFAKNLIENDNLITKVGDSLLPSFTSQQTAAYWFKKIFGE